jgi:hypothetical protein
MATHDEVKVRDGGRLPCEAPQIDRHCGQNSVGDPLVRALSDALQSAASDGLVPRDIAGRLRAALRQQKRRRETMSLVDLIGALPPFDALPEAARHRLFAAVANDDSWSMALRRATWRQALTRAIRTAGLRIPRQYRRSRAVLGQAEVLFLYWQARLVHALYRKALVWRGWMGRTPPLAAALAIAGIDARVIASSYLRGTPQPLDTAGYWQRRSASS